jgi:hypothetical protein
MIQIPWPNTMLENCFVGMPSKGMFLKGLFSREQIGLRRGAGGCRSLSGSLADKWLR